MIRIETISYLYTCQSDGHYDIIGRQLNVSGVGNFRIVPTPRHLGRSYLEMLDCVDIPCAPRLVTVAWAKGMGGFYLPGLIVVGLREGTDLAQRLWDLRFSNRVHPAHVQRRFDELVRFVMQRVLAHELGHALLDAGYETPYYDDEAGADYLAGRLDAAGGRSCALGQLLFWSIGCVGPQCSHPAPGQRAEAYTHGYTSQRHVLAA